MDEGQLLYHARVGNNLQKLFVTIFSEGKEDNIVDVGSTITMVFGPFFSRNIYSLDLNRQSK